MRLPRFFQPSQFIQGEEVLLQPEVARHVIKVLRLNLGDSLSLFNGTGGEYKAQISQIYKNKAWVRIEGFNPREAESPLNLELGQGISRGDKMDYTIQKAVELGINSITPLLTAYCNLHLSKERWINRHRHWQAVAISACEQTGRNRIPHIKMPIQLNEWLNQLTTTQRLILDPHSGPENMPLDITPHSAISLLIGPEGGFSQAEVNLSLQHQFKRWKLGQRILRTETAAVVALAILQYQWGDLK